MSKQTVQLIFTLTNVSSVKLSIYREMLYSRVYRKTDTKLAVKTRCIRMEFR